MTTTRTVHVMLTFDVDGPSKWIHNGYTSPSDLSRGEFTVVGTRRVLGLLERHAVPATFFVPGHTALTYPDLVAAVVDAGHEIGHHGWIHETPASLTPDEERDVLERGRRAIEEVARTRPHGYRAPNWELSALTTALLAEEGFAYDSSMMADDHDFYWCRSGDRTSLDEPMSFGEEVPVVEVPIAWHLDDMPLFEFLMKPGRVMRGLAPPSDALDIWLGDLEYLIEHLSGTVFTLTMHPEVIGRGHRLAVLDKFIERAASYDGVRFTTCMQAVDRWKADRPPFVPGSVSEVSGDHRPRPA